MPDVSDRDFNLLRDLIKDMGEQLGRRIDALGSTLTGVVSAQDARITKTENTLYARLEKTEAMTETRITKSEQTTDQELAELRKRQDALEGTVNTWKAQLLVLAPLSTIAIAVATTWIIKTLWP